MLQCLDAQESQELREFLRDSGYTTQTLKARFGHNDIPQLHLLKLYLLGIPLEPNRLNILLRWFWIGVAVESTTAREFIPERILELLLKSGVLAAAAASHSRQVVATDLNARAREFCLFNAALNGMPHVEFITMDQPPTVTLVSTPPAGVGSGMFTFTATATSGLLYFYGEIGPQQGSTSNCSFFYYAPGSMYYSAYSGTNGLGWNNSPGNYSCIVNADSSATLNSNGTTVTLNVDITFEPALSGQEQIWLNAYDTLGIESGWQTEGQWNIPAAPAVTSFTPARGAPGTQVTINGGNFGLSQGTGSVTFGGVAATSIVSWSATQIVALVPSSAVTGPLTVTVYNTPGTANGNFTVLTPPTVVIEAPPSNTVISGTYQMSGWALDTYSLIDPNSLRATVGSNPLATVGGSYGYSRPDVCNNYPSSYGCAMGGDIGWGGYTIDSTTVPSGANQVLTVSAANEDSPPMTGSASATVTIDQPPTITISSTPAAGFGNGAFSFAFQTGVGVEEVWVSASNGTNEQCWIAYYPGAATLALNTFNSQGFVAWENGTLASGLSNGACSVTGSYSSPDGLSGTLTLNINFTGMQGMVGIAPAVFDTYGLWGETLMSWSTALGPTITSFTLSGVPGATVTLNGANFGSTQGSSTVAFAGTSAPVPATVTAWSATSITVTVPSGAVSGLILVTVNGLTGPTGGNFTVGTSPGSISFSPTSAGPGDTVTITGTNFGSSGTVAFAGTMGPAYATATAWSATSITVTVPSAAVTGAITVTVNGVSMSSTQPFILSSDPPQIRFFSPTAASPGAQVSIYGNGFGKTQGTSTVSIGGVGATVVVWSSAYIVALVPSNAGNAPVVVTVPGMSQPLTSLQNFSPKTGPMITSFFPANSYAGGVVWVLGSGFGSSGTLLFGGTAGVAATSIYSWTDTEIVASVPSVPAVDAVAPIVIDNLNGTLISVASFMILPANQSTIVYIDPPPAIVAGTYNMSGWAVDYSNLITNVQVSSGTAFNLQPATLGADRPEACTFTWPGCPNVGWNYALDTTKLAPGTEYAAATATSAASAQASINASFFVDQPPVVTLGANQTAGSGEFIFTATANNGIMSGNTWIFGTITSSVTPSQQCTFTLYTAPMLISFNGGPWVPFQLNGPLLSSPLGSNLCVINTDSTFAVSPDGQTGTLTLDITFPSGGFAVSQPGTAPVQISADVEDFCLLDSGWQSIQGGWNTLSTGAPPAPADFTMSAPTPALMTVNAGGAAPYPALTVSATSNSSLTATLSCSGLPTGLTISFCSGGTLSVPSPGSMTGTVTAAATTPLGLSNVTVTATSGSYSHSVTVPITVTGPPSFTVSNPKVAVSVLQGQSTTFTETIIPLNGFVLTSPSGSTNFISFSQFDATNITVQSTTQTNGVVTVVVDAGSVVTLGTYSVNLWAATPGVALHLVGILTLTVSSSPPQRGFQIEPPPGSISLVAGGLSADIFPTIDGLNGFGGAPQNETVVFSSQTSGFAVDDCPNPIADAYPPGLADLKICAASGLSPGSYQVRIKAASGSSTQFFLVAVMVGTQPPIRLTAALSSPDAAVGQPVTITGSIVPLNNFTGAVTLSVSGLPVGVVASPPAVQIANSSMPYSLPIAVTDPTLQGVFQISLNAAPQSSSLTVSQPLTLHIVGNYVVVPQTVNCAPGGSCPFTQEVLPVGSKGSYAASVTFASFSGISITSTCAATDAAPASGSFTPTVTSQQFCVKVDPSMAPSAMQGPAPAAPYSVGILAAGSTQAQLSVYVITTPASNLSLGPNLGPVDLGKYYGAAQAAFPSCSSSYSSAQECMRAALLNYSQDQHVTSVTAGISLCDSNFGTGFLQNCDQATPVTINPSIKSAFIDFAKDLVNNGIHGLGIRPSFDYDTDLQGAPAGHVATGGVGTCTTPANITTNLRYLPTLPFVEVGYMQDNGSVGYDYLLDNEGYACVYSNPGPNDPWDPNQPADEHYRNFVGWDNILNVFDTMFQAMCTAGGGIVPTCANGVQLDYLDVQSELDLSGDSHEVPFGQTVALRKFYDPFNRYSRALPSCPRTASMWQTQNVPDSHDILGALRCIAEADGMADPFVFEMSTVNQATSVPGFECTTADGLASARVTDAEQLMLALTNQPFGSPPLMSGVTAAISTSYGTEVGMSCPVPPGTFGASTLPLGDAMGIIYKQLPTVVDFHAYVCLIDGTNPDLPCASTRTPPITTGPTPPPIGDPNPIPVAYTRTESTVTFNDLSALLARYHVTPKIVIGESHSATDHSGITCEGNPAADPREEFIGLRQSTINGYAGGTSVRPFNDSLLPCWSLPALLTTNGYDLLQQ